MKHLARVVYLLALWCVVGCGGGSSTSTPTPAPTTPLTTPPNIAGSWEFLESGNILFVNLVQNGETLTASAATDGEPVDCTPLVPNTPVGGCFSVVPCNESVSGSITNAGDINTLMLSGCPGASNITTFSSTINAAGNMGTSVNGYLVPSIADNYQGTLSVALLESQGSNDIILGTVIVPVTLSVTGSTNNSVTAVLNCPNCAVGAQQITFSGTVVGGAFHSTSSPSVSYPAIFTLDAAPIIASATGTYLGLNVTTNGLGYQFFGISVPINSALATSAGLAQGNLSLSGP